MSTSEAISEFWQLFIRKSNALAKIKSADDVVYDELLAKLQRIDAGLFFQFSTESGERELVITAEGDRSLFNLVDSILAAAPQVKGWTFFALKPKVGLPESIEWDGYLLNVADVVFDPLVIEESGELGLRLLVPDLQEDRHESAHNALLRVLDHALGERRFAEEVQYTEIGALDAPADEYIPLAELESFLEWRTKRRGN